MIPKKLRALGLAATLGLSLILTACTVPIPPTEDIQSASQAPPRPELRDVPGIVDPDNTGWPRTVEGLNGSTDIEAPPERIITASVGHDEMVSRPGAAGTARGRGGVFQGSDLFERGRAACRKAGDLPRSRNHHRPGSRHHRHQPLLPRRGCRSPRTGGHPGCADRVGSTIPKHASTTFCSLATSSVRNGTGH